ncbi:hypothetical protein Tco_0783956 [Tanacetum coccineum]
MMLILLRLAFLPWRGIRKGMVTGSGSPRSRWLTKDMVHSIKSGNQVLNPKPLSKFNPRIGHVVKFSEVNLNKDKALADVIDKASADVSENQCV